MKLGFWFLKFIKCMTKLPNNNNKKKGFLKKLAFLFIFFGREKGTSIYTQFWETRKGEHNLVGRGRAIRCVWSVDNDPNLEVFIISKAKYKWCELYPSYLSPFPSNIPCDISLFFKRAFLSRWWQFLCLKQHTWMNAWWVMTPRYLTLKSGQKEKRRGGGGVT